MALSKPIMQGTPQHFLECGTEDCEKNCEFYCNSCHHGMCKNCRDLHLKIQENQNHEVVLYQQRKRQLPVEKCKIHPTKEIDILCEECNVPLCSKCSTMQEHRGHQFFDLEMVYTDKFKLCQKEISKIYNYFIPTAQDVLSQVREDVTEIKNITDIIRTSMKAEAEILKSIVDTVLSDNMEELDQIEQSVLEDLKSQEKTYNNYIAYLSDLVKEYQSYLASTELTKFTSILPENLEIKSIPETTKPIKPEFFSAQYTENDVASLLGKITVTDRKREARRVKPMEIAPSSSSIKSASEQSKQDKQVKSDKKHLSARSVNKVRELNVPGVSNVYHISLGQSDKLWISNDNGVLVQADLQGNMIQKIKTSGGMEGYHTVTQEGDMLYTDGNKKLINKVTKDNNITEFLKTGDWEPYSIHSSIINGDLLVGMWKDKEARVTRYSKTGKEVQNIQRDNKGQGLYGVPTYITENINGDICTSDWEKKSVVVVNKSGQHRFSYTGHESKFSPFGICTDVFCHILVCDRYSETVHLLDQDGQFLSLLLTQQHWVKHPKACSLCVDDENNLFVGQLDTNTLTVYTYLK
ncbi:uncharacterized protein LOC133198393 [Saccostrea echinata]|uniref:uncharacterized protein LOC133198393 n=1 Tax=Saccostrea echinata TaxID=191078 RepID=UPI002A83E48D|nr:uncharacterized protein LOC133198393 [Saccostrea echinata]